MEKVNTRIKVCCSSMEHCIGDNNIGVDETNNVVIKFPTNNPDFCKTVGYHAQYCFWCGKRIEISKEN